MRVVESPEALAALRESLPSPVGLIPTMGALHDGHLSLVAAAKRDCASAITSIFVNPTQFSATENFSGYPRDSAGDLDKLAASGCDAAWLPGVAALYPPGQSTMIDPAGPALEWEGRFRPGHFRGVATVVAKLFGLVRPDFAYFGEKDWQQLQVVKRVVADLVLPVQVVGVPTVREADGLAMSSRNRFLSPPERATAPRLYAALRLVADGLSAGQPAEAALANGRRLLEEAGLGVDYLALVESQSLLPTTEPAGARLIATVRMGKVRLLDNIPAAT